MLNKNNHSEFSQKLDKVKIVINDYSVFEYIFLTSDENKKELLKLNKIFDNILFKEKFFFKNVR